tara:strand:+ start:116 stop:400 length:285 start_codon:yes stop_codon:yes gene_type:complete
VQWTKTNLKIIKKVSKVLPSSKISDHWKECIVPTYAMMLMKNSLMILAILLGIILVFLVFYFISPSLYTLAISIIGILESIAIIIIYNQIKKRL